MASEHVLVVAPSRFMRDMLTDLLEVRAYTVAAADGVATASAAVAKQLPGVVIVDVQAMTPEEVGALRAQAKAPLVLLSGVMDNASMDFWLSTSGAGAVVGKPFNPQMVITAIAEAKAKVA